MSNEERDRDLFEHVMTVYRRFREQPEIGREESAPVIAADLTASYFAAKTSSWCEDVDANVNALINVVKYR